MWFCDFVFLDWKKKNHYDIYKQNNPKTKQKQEKETNKYELTSTWQKQNKEDSIQIKVI